MDSTDLSFRLVLLSYNLKVHTCARNCVNTIDLVKIAYHIIYTIYTTHFLYVPRFRRAHKRTGSLAKPHFISKPLSLHFSLRPGHKRSLDAQVRPVPPWHPQGPRDHGWLFRGCTPPALPSFADPTLCLPRPARQPELTMAVLLATVTVMQRTA